MSCHVVAEHIRGNFSSLKQTLHKYSLSITSRDERANNVDVKEKNKHENFHTA